MNPGGVVAGREPRVAVVQRQGERLEPRRAGSVEVDDEQEAEVVAQDRVGPVVVQEVAEVVEDASGDAVEHVCRMAGDERGAGVQEFGGRAADLGKGDAACSAPSAA